MFAPAGERYRNTNAPGGRTWYIILDYFDTETSKAFNLPDFAQQLQELCGEYNQGSWEMGLRFQPHVWYPLVSLHRFGGAQLRSTHP